MPTIGPYTFSVLVNGQALREYEPPADEGYEPSEKSRVVYIEAVEGAKFEIQTKVRGHLAAPTKQVEVRVYIDNEGIIAHNISKSKCSSLTGITFIDRNVVHLLGQTWVEQDFQFSNLETTEGMPKSDSWNKEAAQRIGTIRLMVYNVTGTTSTEQATKSSELTRKTKIPEKALKGQPIDMATEFGEARPTTQRRVRNASKAVGSPIVDCIFKYRSRKALQMLEMIPATPEPVALSERDPNTLSLAEARELLAQMRQQGGGMGVVKKERSGIKQEKDSNKLLPQMRDRKRTASSMTHDGEASDDDDDVVFVEAKRVKSLPSDQIEVLDLS